MFTHLRHRPPVALDRARDLVLACAPLRSRANLSSIVRTAGCCGVAKVIACGNGRVDRRVARDSTDHVTIEVHRTLSSVLKQLGHNGYKRIGLEQTTNSRNLHTYAFPRNTALVIGNERLGLTDEELKFVDDCVEIPVWGLPYSYNVATATAIALYEYCKQYPSG
ncbi:MAG: TrmH family RNA methyltransferase [Pseudonocardiaceae bacterium]